MASKENLPENIIFYEHKIQGKFQEIPVNLTFDETKRLLQELKLKEIELELQNEQLRKTNAELERKLEIFTDEKILLESENNLKFAEKIAHVGSFQHNLETDECTWSDELFRLCGIEPQSIKTTKEAFIDIFHPDDKEQVLESFLDAISTKTGYKKEFRILRPNGEIRHVISIGQIITDQNDNAVEIKGALQDVTDLKNIQICLRESEENYRTLFETMPVGLAISDSHGKITYGNKKSRILLGISRTDLKKGLIDLSNWKFVNKDGSEILKPDLPNNKVLRENKLIENSEIGIIKENNELMWLNVTAAPLQNMNEVLIAFIDITEQVEREKQLKQLSEKLQELNATKDKFFSIIAHDLKNPFNSILGFSELMTKNITRYKYEEIERFVGIIHSTSQNAYNLLENLLNWSRSQTGTIEFSPHYYDLTQLILNNIEFVENSALKKNIKIYFNRSEISMVKIDKNMMDTVLRNLLTNSIKFTYPGGKIIVTVSSEEKNYKVSIKDNGIGIEEENIDKLFRIDSKYSSYGTNQEKGSGLGLIITKEFIEKNNGKIWANSEFGKGSEFIFTLPKANA